jgi:hypothetical protein
MIYPRMKRWNLDFAFVYFCTSNVLHTSPWSAPLSGVTTEFCGHRISCMCMKSLMRILRRLLEQSVSGGC